ncbi:DMT family transporter [Pelagovum pacificum]|uniref:DMT family transporter n=1 Tax=Pelagovum pacificum TaxID=2588711 RepID=A0A5C5GH80_9RHOB|nr:DMT family transporter [Pelagovum pacificum]QQA44015.1 DMT family transporter [Pelagovum pacificum]TNY32856.1 DMT family transporter [Pelagovum pacificum]
MTATPTPLPAPHRRALIEGIGLRLAATFLMTAMSAAVHAVAKEGVPVGQVMFWRSALAIPPILLWMALRGNFPGGLRTRHPKLHVTRGTLGALSMALSFLSLAYLPVANAQALAYLAPVLTLPLAAILLKETLGPAVIFAVGLGFAGVVALLWEALALPGDGALLGVAAGLAYAVTMAWVRVHTKRMTVTESASTIAFYFALVAAVAGLATLPFGWESLSAAHLGWLVFAGLAGGIGHIVSNEAVARAPVSVLAPFDFTGLIWALGFDIVLFSVLPGPLGLLGVLAITAAGVMVSIPRRAR